MIVSFTTQPIPSESSHSIISKFKRHSADVVMHVRSVADTDGAVFVIIQGYAPYDSSIFLLMDDLAQDDYVFVSGASVQGTYSNE